MDESRLKTILENLEKSRSSLHSSLRFWEWVVVAGVALELIVLVSEFWHGWRAWRRGTICSPDRPSVSLLCLGLLGVGLVAGGIAKELSVDSKSEGVETEIRKANEQLFGLVAREAESAVDSSSRAKTESSDAIGLAQGTRQQVSSLGKEMVSAKKQATNAEQHLADALREAARAEAELKKIRSPRSIISEVALVAALTRFQGTEYTLSTFQDEEAFQLTRDIGRILRAANWVRKQPEKHNLGMTYFNIFSQDRKDSVPLCVETGIQISVQENESLAILESMPVQNLPQNLQAAMALRDALSPSVVPSDERNVGNQVRLDDKPGEGPIVICVGRKP